MMPLHHRHNARPNDDSSRSTEQISPSKKAAEDSSAKSHGLVSLETTTTTTTTSKIHQLQFLVLTQVALLTLVVSWSEIKSKLHFVGLVATLFIASLPVFTILAVGLGVFDYSSSDLPHQRYIPLVVVATIVGNQLPMVLGSGMAAAGILLFGLSSRPIPRSLEPVQEGRAASKSKLSGPMKAVLAVILMTTVLLTENFFIWVVSATYKPGQNLAHLPEPLQDNGQIIMRHFLNNVLEWTKRDIVRLRNMINVEWILVSGLGMSLVAVEMQGPAIQRNLWSVALRGLFTMTLARVIRTISFLITVLPSQNPRCYFSHFPVPPPADWSTWLMIGFIPQANGGCNDLIISGHATVTSTLACIVTSVVGNGLFSAALWTLVAIDYMVEIYEGFHYSVDMWLGAIIVNFIWHTLAGVEEPSALVGTPAKRFYGLGEASRADWIKFAIPVSVAWIQVTGLVVPEDKANYTILVFIVTVIYQISSSGFQQYTQHCLFCLLYLALGIYL
jgi:PAP2 superfamily C-terminal